MASGRQAVSSKQALLLLLPCTLFSAVVAAAAYRRGLAKGAAAAAANSSSKEERSGETSLYGDGCDTADEAAVESVLAVWFDGSTAENHRTKWFAQVCFVPRDRESS